MANVTIYSTPTCPFCQMAKEFFKEHNIEYTDIDISKDEEKQKEMIEKSKQMGVPVIEIDGEIVVGFEKKQLAKLLKIDEK